MSETMVTENDVIQPGIPPRMLDKYVCRVLKAEFGPSKAGNPMVTLESEICSPASKTVDSKTYGTDGLKFKSYYPLLVKDNKGQIDEEGTKKARGRYLQLRKVLGLNPSFDPSNPGEKEFEGIVYEQIIDSTQKPHMRTNDKGEQEPIIDEATKQPLMAGWQIAPRDVLGRSSMEVNRPF